MSPVLVLIIRLLILILTYVFVGWIAYSIFTDLSKSSLKGKPFHITPITLTIAQNDEKASRVFTSPQITLGRDPANDYFVDHPTVSLRHCKLSFQGKQWWVEDLNSTNGSFLNDSQIESPNVLTDGDIIRLGDLCITIQFN